MYVPVFGLYSVRIKANMNQKDYVVGYFHTLFVSMAITNQKTVQYFNILCCMNIFLYLKTQGKKDVGSWYVYQ